MCLINSSLDLGLHSASGIFGGFDHGQKKSAMAIVKNGLASLLRKHLIFVAGHEMAALFENNPESATEFSIDN